jgi:hypothetical protein
MKDNGMIVVLVHQINKMRAITPPFSSSSILQHSLSFACLSTVRLSHSQRSTHARTYDKRLTPKRHLTDVDDKGKAG